MCEDLVARIIMITYMPTHLAQKSLKNSVTGPSLAKVPNELDAFKCLVFHVLYHKGFRSRIDLANDDLTGFAGDNDYLGLLKNKAEK